MQTFNAISPPDKGPIRPESAAGREWRLVAVDRPEHARTGLDRHLSDQRGGGLVLARALVRVEAQGGRDQAPVRVVEPGVFTDAAVGAGGARHDDGDVAP